MTPHMVATTSQGGGAQASQCTAVVMHNIIENVVEESSKKDDFVIYTNVKSDMTLRMTTKVIYLVEEVMVRWWLVLACMGLLLLALSAVSFLLWWLPPSQKEVRAFHPSS